MWNATGPDSNGGAPIGIAVDYASPEDVYWSLNIAITIIFDIFITAFFLIRMYVKLCIQRKILVEDLARYGAGYHAWEIPKNKYYNWLKWFYVSTVIYCPAAFFTKTTILLVIARVFAVERRVSIGIRFFVWASLVAYTPMEFVRIFVCSPIRTLWDPLVKHGRCLNQRKVFFASLALAILTDTIILLIPIPLVYKMNAPARTKVKIALLLGVGGLATSFTIFRTYKVAKFLNSDDNTVDYTPIEMLISLEITIGFVCSCFPSLNLL
ncbi:hypothetical protein DER46DRAFT_538101, partial [Fusarium sp. MPI-SDFR-AT-0072]